jgi:hypothetical protein
MQERRKMFREMKVSILFLFLIVAIVACSNKALTETVEPIATTTTFALPPTWTPSPTPSVKDTPSALPTPTFTPELLLTPAIPLPQSWFLIPSLTPIDSSNPLNSQSYEGIKIPPLPDGIVEEFTFITPYGEGPSWRITYELHFVRQEDRGMLWLGVPLENGSAHRIFDAIPLPAVQAGDILISFTCRQNDLMDLLLVVIAAYPKEGEPATDIRFAWRIDPTSATLQPVSKGGIVCSPNWPA